MMRGQVSALRAPHTKRVTQEIGLLIATQHTPVALLTLDHGCRILEANPAAEEIAGTALGGQRFCDVFCSRPCDESAGTSCLFMHALRGFERRSHPRWTTLEPRNTPQAVLFKATATPFGAAVTLIPNTIVDDADRRRREMIAAAIHDLRLPVTAQSLAIELLTTQLASDATAGDARMLLSKLQRATSFLAVSIDDLLNRMMFELNNQTVHPVTIAVLPALEILIWYLQPMLERRQQTVRLDVPKDLTVRADSAALEQMVVNLVFNAHKYSVDQDRIVIAARARPALNATEIQVRDHGPGVPAHERRRVFDRFYRGENVARQRGAGLGLTIVRTLAARHGGSAGVRAARGGGAVFWIRLPNEAPTYSD
jgi:signal transduction histidine kinase